MEFFEDLGEMNPKALIEEGEVDEVPSAFAADPEMAEVERRLDAGEDIESILDSWEDEPTKEFWRKRGEKTKAETPAPAPPTAPEPVPEDPNVEDEFDDDYSAGDAGPVRPPLKLT